MRLNAREQCAATLLEIVGRAAVVEIQFWREWNQRRQLSTIITQFLQAAWILLLTLGGILPLQETTKVKKMATLNLIHRRRPQGR